MTLKEARLDKLISQRELARLSGVAYSTICRIETGKHKPSELTRAKLAKALGIGVSKIAW
jgi:transcriptional regulator with XRE-family HTH domain